MNRIVCLYKHFVFIPYEVQHNADDHDNKIFYQTHIKSSY